MENLIFKKTINKIIHKLILHTRLFFGNHFVWLKLTVLYFLLLVKKNDKRLKTFQNKHEGQRCFIVGNGPSLTINDLEKIKGEICFSTNSSVKLFDKTDWRPHYYVLQDSVAYEILKDQIDHADLPCVFYNTLLIWNFNREGIPFKSNEIYALSIYINKFFPKYRGKLKFSTDITKGIYSGWTTIISIIQIAVYMGFKEIYLVGTDCDYTGPNLHMPDVEYDVIDEAIAATCSEFDLTSGEKMIDSYTQQKVYLDRLGVKVYNATRGGKLEVFPRVNLDEIIS
jgi:hypothetical protein